MRPGVDFSTPERSETSAGNAGSADDRGRAPNPPELRCLSAPRNTSAARGLEPRPTASRGALHDEPLRTAFETPCGRATAFRDAAQGAGLAQGCSAAGQSARSTRRAYAPAPSLANVARTEF